MFKMSYPRGWKLDSDWLIFKSFRMVTKDFVHITLFEKKRYFRFTAVKKELNIDIV